MKKGMPLDFATTLLALQTGRVVIYPTETFYALGAVCGNEAAVERIAAIKNRAPDKPFPLVAGSLEQVQEFAELAGVASHIARRFWPGPLSILLPCKKSFSSALCDRDGFIAVRVSSHPVAQNLCLQSESLLVATSANFAGKMPACRLENCDADLLAAVDGYLVQEPFPSGEKPSTLVRIDGNEITVLRNGAIPAQMLLER